MEKETAAPAPAELEIPGECQYAGEPAVVRPSQPTPRHTLYLSNLDDQRFLRFSIKYLYVFAAAAPADALRAALAAVLVDYYPLAGRLRASDDDEGKLVVDCNAEGALFAEAALPGLTAGEFLRRRALPHKSWRKLLYRVDAQSFVAVPPLIVQVSTAHHTYFFSITLLIFFRKETFWSITITSIISLVSQFVFIITHLADEH
ncbi:hypothetical protein ACP4OV_020830 [Aristida adscensionis]